MLTSGVWPFLLVRTASCHRGCSSVGRCFRSMRQAPDRVSTVSKLVVVHTSNPKTQKAEAGDQKFSFISGCMSFRPAWDT